jgi:hypothetical protein
MGLTNQDPGCCCEGCTTTFCAEACGTFISGITMTVASNTGVALGSCVTGSGGCCSIAIPAAAVVSVTPTGGGFSPGATFHSVTCGGTTAIQLLSITDTNPAQCCADCILPNTMTLTDANGSLAFTVQPESSQPTWIATTVIQTPSFAPSPLPEECLCPTPESGPLTITYTGTFTINDSNECVFTVTRSWAIAGCTVDLSNLDLCAPPSFFFLDGSTCLSNAPEDCQAHDSTTVTQAPSSCNPFMWSGTLTGAVGTTGDPVGGTVTVIA